MATLPPVLPDTATARRNLRVGLLAFMGALFMLGLGYASVPLYRLFCQVTGFAGTTMIASESEAARAAKLATGQKISIRFDATPPTICRGHFTHRRPPIRSRSGSVTLQPMSPAMTARSPLPGWRHSTSPPNRLANISTRSSVSVSPSRPCNRGRKLSCRCSILSIRRCSTIRGCKVLNRSR